MTRSKGTGSQFDVGDLLRAVRAAATPEEQASANEAIHTIAAAVRSNRPANATTALRTVASEGRRATARLGAAFVVTS